MTSKSDVHSKTIRQCVQVVRRVNVPIPFQNAGENIMQDILYFTYALLYVSEKIN